MSVAIIIPSRYSSTRLPAKALADISGKPLIQWVYEACKKVNGVSRVIIATDHLLIKDAGLAFDADVRMTSEDHQSGTDRCAELAKELEEDYIINVQGDEPFVDPLQLEAMISHLTKNPPIEILTLFHEMQSNQDVEDPSKVKLTKTKEGKILYFSRAVIPYRRNDGVQKYFKHVGIYAFKKVTLLKLAKLKPSDLELTEGLEQLRWLENDYSIYGIEASKATMGVDTHEDLERARAYARNHY